MAPKTLSRLVSSLPVDPTYRDVITNAFVFVHQSLHKLNDTLRKKGSTNKTIIITPSHFLDAIQHFVNNLFLINDLLCGMFRLKSLQKNVQKSKILVNI